MQHLSESLPALPAPSKRRQRAGWHGRCRRHEKIFGPAPGQKIDKNVKARILFAARAYNARVKLPRQHWGPITRAIFEVLRTLLYGFHHNDKGGRCFPSYERAAQAARCHRDTFYEAIKVLEEAGLLTWCNRIVRIRVFERDLFGHRVARDQVIRTSNCYRFADPLDREPGRQGYKSENPTGPEKQEVKEEEHLSSARLAGAPVIGVGETADALLIRHGWFHSSGKEMQRA
jgi:hypothetical protein